MGAAARLMPGSSSSLTHIVHALIRVGIISGAHGLQGALRLRLDNPDSDSLFAIDRVFVKPAGENTEHEYRLIGATRLSRLTVRVVLEGISNATAAETLKGGTVSIAGTDLPAAAPGEYYHFEAIGCAVETLEGRRVGTIEEVIATGANDVWVVRDGAREVLIPVIENIVKSMDLTHRLMRIEVVPGLLD